MKIFEARGKIKDIKDTINITEKIGGIFKGFYSCKDIIFKADSILKADSIFKTDSEKGVIMLRIFKINNRPAKNYIFTHKIPEWSNKIKTDRIILKNRFDTIEEALNFMTDHYGDVLKKDYEYSRKGWEYHLNKNGIFIEYIEKLGPTLEIEAENKNDLENLFKFFEVIELFSEPTSEIMRKLQKHSN